MKRIPLSRLVAVSFAAVFIVALAISGLLIYSSLEEILWMNGLKQMNSHIRYVMQDIKPLETIDPNPDDFHRVAERPVEVPDIFFSNPQKIADDLRSDIFLATLTDADGNIIAQSPPSQAPELAPRQEFLKMLRDKWENTDNAPAPPNSNRRRPNPEKPRVWPFAIHLPLFFAPPSELTPEKIHHGPLRLDYLVNKDRQVIVVPLSKNGRIAGFAQLVSSWRLSTFILDNFSRVMCAVSIACGAVISLVGFWLAGFLIKPLTKVAKTAESITKGSFNARTGLPDGKNEIYMVGKTFDDMADKVEEAFMEQKRFVADASHELKTPLTSLMGYMHVLSILDEDIPQNPKREKIMKSADHELCRMEELVADLLTLSRNAEAFSSKPTDPINIRELVNNAVSQSLSQTMNHEIKLVSIPDIWILGDEKALSRALRNLLDNALRFTPAEKNITVTAEQDKDELKIAVTDEGCGIAPDHLKNLGKRFYRADESRARKSGGTGLGLAITMAIAKRHGGRLEIESGQGKGTKASLILPIPEK